MLAIARKQIPQGRRAKLRIKIPKAIRRLLRKAKRRGVRRIRATARLRATIIPGVSTTKRVKLRILLKKPKTKGRRKRR